MNDDIKYILDDWPYDPDEDLMVRIIEGDDGKKLQMRIDMGIIQMELDGNPTGENPEGFESWFEYYMDRRERAESNEVNDFFALEEEDCGKLRIEAVRYYYRYLCCMKLGDYERVIRDTTRNYNLFAFIKRYAVSEMDRWALDQYRPYVIMMNTRAQASYAIKQELNRKGKATPDKPTGIQAALEFIDEGIDEIVGFYEEYGITSEMENSVELSILKALKNEFIKNLPLSLEDQLKMAVEEERFEDAAMLRDQIRSRFKRN